MLSLFPGLLYLAPLATALIRIAAGLTLLHLSYEFIRTREHIAHTKVMGIHVPQWLTLFGALVIFIAGVLLAIGLYTQAIAIVGMLVGLKHAVFARRYPGIMPISAGMGLLLFIICLSLLFSGAGAFAFDLPL